MPVLKQNEVFAGRYILSQFIGEGGFSEVWKAKDQMADEAVVAIKIYAPGKGLDDYGVRQFRREFSLTHHLSHPHLLKVYHFDIFDGFPYLIMPFCSEGSLTIKLRENGVLTEKQVAQVMVQIGSALEELHRQEIIHQDIKPDNILVSQPEYYLLADFGISSQIRHTMRKATSTLESLTVAYAPPERFDRNPSADASSDIFSLGVTLYEMCTNTVPWDGAGGQSLLKGALVPGLPAGFSTELSKILEACMALDRTQRPTAAEIHAKGKHFLETGKWTMPKKRKSARKGSAVPYLIAAAVALIALGGWVYTEYKDVYFTSLAGTSKEVAAVSTPADAENENAKQLEDKLKTIEAQLIKTNQMLLQQDSINKILAQNKAGEQNQDRLVNRGQDLQGATENEKQQIRLASKESSSVNSTQAIQKSLNQISDPKISKEVRSGWKQEALAKFADGYVRVLDESDGTLTEYRAGIFLTLLLSSPHQVVVREVKKDQNNKISELRLSKQPIK